MQARISFEDGDGSNDENEKSSRRVLPSADGSLLGMGTASPRSKVCRAPAMKPARLRRVAGDKRDNLLPAGWIVPINIADLVPAMHFMDVIDGGTNYHYRDVGALQIEARRYDPTGRRCATSMPARSRPRAGELCVGLPQPWGIIDRSIDISPNPRFCRMGNPVPAPSFADDDGVHPTQVLVYSHYHQLSFAEAAAREVVARAAAAKSAQIGFRRLPPRDALDEPSP